MSASETDNVPKITICKAIAWVLDKGMRSCLFNGRKFCRSRIRMVRQQKKEEKMRSRLMIYLAWMVIFSCIGIVVTGAMANCQAADTPEWVLTVDPYSRSVEKAAGTTSFSVSNTGSGIMNWHAEVLDCDDLNLFDNTNVERNGGCWLSITSGDSGVNSGTIFCSYLANSGSLTRTATIRVYADILHVDYKDVTVTQAGLMVLNVSPNSWDVTKDVGYSTFSVSHDGAGTMYWVSAVKTGNNWARITSGDFGIDSGTVKCDYNENTEASARTASIWITAFDMAGNQLNISGNPKAVTINQAPAPIEPTQPVLSVTPVNRNVTKDVGNTTFSVANTGTGNLNWVSQVVSGSSWMYITSGFSGTNAGTVNCAYSANLDSTPRTGTVRITAAGATGSPVDVTVIQAGDVRIGSNSIDAIDVIKITDMSGTLPEAGTAVGVRAWDKNGSELSPADYAPPLFIFNHATTSILGSDIEDRFPGGIPAAYVFAVESPKMLITNVNNSMDGEVKAPITYSNGLSNFVSNTVGSRNAIKVTDMSGTLPSSGTAITVTAWDAAGNAIPESISAAPLVLYSHGTTIINGTDLAARFPTGTPMTYAFTSASAELVITNLKYKSDGTLKIPAVYSLGLSNFVSNAIGPQNTLYISDFSGALGTTGAAISVRAWDVSGTEIPESASASVYNIFNYETVTITGSDLESRFSSGSPMTYEFTVGSQKHLITNVKSSTDGSIKIPTVYTQGITNYTTNYVSDLNTIQITDMSGSISATGANIGITARNVDGILIPESTSAPALKLYSHGTTSIEGNDLINRFPSGIPVSYEFSIGSTSAIVTNLMKSSDGMIYIPTVFTIGPYGVI